ncbi:MAG: rod shape-determining protein MreD [Rhodospirillales bacterium]
MTPLTFSQRLDHVARQIVPCLSVLILILISAIPFHLPFWGVIAPMLSLPAIFYWAVHRPDLIPPSMAFLLGLFQDAIIGTPLGVGALILLLMQGGVSAQSTVFYGKSFLINWWGFGMVTAPAMLLFWLLVSMIDSALVPFLPVVFQYLIMIGLYPVLNWLLARLQYAALRQEI